MPRFIHKVISPISSRFMWIYSVIVTVFIVSCLLASVPAYSVTVDRVLATVDGEIITFADYQQFANSISGIEKKDGIDERLLKGLIEEKIILQEAKRRVIEVSETEVDTRIEDFKAENGLSQEDFENLLREDGLNIPKYKDFVKNDLLSLKLIHENIDSKVIVTDKEIEDLYYVRKKDYLICTEKLEVKAIFIRLKEDATPTEITDLKLRALKIAEQLKEGTNFDLLAEEYSDEPLKSHESILGCFVKGALIPPLDNKVFSMKEGETSDPVWVSEGVYILKITNREAEIYKTIEEVREELYNILYKQKRGKLFTEWIKALWERASVILNQG
ncbi:MAG: SurA N-terminal domain-containing protein [Thermodesulfovibrionales bacterium]